LSGIEAEQQLAPDAIRRLAALVGADVAPDKAQNLAARLRLSNDERDRLKVLVSSDTSLTPDMEAALLRAALYRMGQSAVIDLAVLAWAGEAAAGRSDVAGWKALIETARNWKKTNFPLAGKDVLALGLKRGPAIGQLLGAVEAWWIEGDMRAGRDACLRRLKDVARRESTLRGS
jgi:poly(A) polymerase